MNIVVQYNTAQICNNYKIIISLKLYNNSKYILKDFF